MSQRDSYQKAAKKDMSARIAAELQRAATYVASDIAVINGAIDRKMSAQFLTNLRMIGKWDRAQHTLTYKLLQGRVELETSFDDACAQMRDRHPDVRPHERNAIAREAIETEILPRARQQIIDAMKQCREMALPSSHYHVVHAVCADPAVDMRVEVIVLPTVASEHRAARFRSSYDYAFGAEGKLLAMPHLMLRIYLHQPYRASSDAGIHLRKPADKAHAATAFMRTRMFSH